MDPALIIIIIIISFILQASILESEGERDAAINRAEGQKQSSILSSEGKKIEQINEAKGEAEALVALANANAEAISLVAKSLGDQEGKDAVSLKIAEQYIEAFSKLAKEGNTLLLPAGANDPAGMVAQAMSIYGSVQQGNTVGAIGGGGGGGGGASRSS